MHHMLRNGFIWIAAALLACVALSAGAEDLQVGREYTVLTPAQPTSKPDKIVVTEFFSYQCPHCFALSPLIRSWAEKLPKDVVFERVPVTFGRADWSAIAQTYYALQALGKAEKLDSAIFSAIHTQNVKLNSESAVTEWVGKQGVDAKEFSAAYNSFGVKSEMARVEQLTRSYKVQGVPAVYVDGKYEVLGGGIRGYEELLQRTDKLIAKARAEKKK